MTKEESIALMGCTQFAFCFDFFSEINRKKIAEYIIKGTNQRVTYCDKYVKPKQTGINICRNDIGGSKMSQIQIGFLPYFEAINVAFKVFDIIDTYGFTNAKCKAIVSLKIGNNDLKLPKISDINLLKLISSIDNMSQSQKMYKNQHERMYINSLLYIYPKVAVLTDGGMNQLLNDKNFGYPNNKNFNLYSKDIQSNIVTVQYALHKDYQKAKKTFNKYLVKLLSVVVNVLKNNFSYTDDEMAKIKRVLGLQKKIMNTIGTIDALRLNYPKIEVLADLKSEDDVIKTYYNIIKDKLFDLISYCGFDSGSVNYDPERNMFQVRDAVITNGNNISDIEFFYSHINGNFENCKFYECEISSSVIKNSELFHCNSLKNCEVYNTYFHGTGNTIEGCFVCNPDDKLIEADIRKSIVKGPVNLVSYIDEKSETLNN